MVGSVGSQCAEDHATPRSSEPIPDVLQISFPRSLVSIQILCATWRSANVFRLLKRTAIVSRMFYHTGITLLCESNPLSSSDLQVQHEMETWQLQNARELCGIVAHVKDR